MIKGFWHIYMINAWYTIVMGQLRILLTSGLYDACEEIKIGCIGEPLQKSLLEKFIVGVYPKLKIKYYSEMPEMCEFPTLQLIEKDKSKYVGFYFHTKAVTRPTDMAQNNVREWLNEAILNRWEEHVQNIQNGFDVSGVNHLGPPLHPEHYSGNFWWFNRKYINQLPIVDCLDWSVRWAAEQYICMGSGKFFCREWMEPARDIFLIQY